MRGGNEGLGGRGRFGRRGRRRRNRLDRNEVVEMKTRLTGLAAALMWLALAVQFGCAASRSVIVQTRERTVTVEEHGWLALGGEWQTVIDYRSGVAYWNVGGTWEYRITGTEFRPYADQGLNLGDASYRWNEFYATTSVVTGKTYYENDANFDAWTEAFTGTQALGTTAATRFYVLNLLPVIGATLGVSSYHIQLEMYAGTESAKYDISARIECTSIAVPASYVVWATVFNVSEDDAAWDATVSVHPALGGVYLDLKGNAENVTLRYAAKMDVVFIPW